MSKAVEELKVAVHGSHSLEYWRDKAAADIIRKCAAVCEERADRVEQCSGEGYMGEHTAALECAESILSVLEGDDEA